MRLITLLAVAGLIAMAAILLVHTDAQLAPDALARRCHAIADGGNPTCERHWTAGRRHFFEVDRETAPPKAQNLRSKSGDAR